MRGRLYIFGTLIRYVAERKGWSWAVLLAIFLLGILIAAGVIMTPGDVDYPEGGQTSEYRRNMSYLLAAAKEEPPDFSNVKGGFFGSHLAIVSEQDFPQLAKKLRCDLTEATDDRFMFHSIVLGGMKVHNIDEPLLKAAKGLRNSSQANVELVIVEPSTISAETKAILEAGGLKVRLIGPPSMRR